MNDMKDIPYELIARYLAGECNEDEQQQIREWIRQHPDIMAEFSKIWQQVPANDFTPDVEAALHNVHHQLDSKKQNRSRRLFMLVSSAAAVILLLISIVGIRNWNASAPMPAASLLILQTDAGETLEQLLPDGSRIWLNRSSIVRYPETFGHGMREIYLEGEAFFDISPDADRPFVIHAHQTLTRVVGTSFGVRAIRGEDEVVVTVSTGVINLSAEGKAEHMVLNRGEQGACNPELQKLQKNENPDPNLLAWKTRQFVFKQALLSEVVQLIEEVYHTPLSVDSSIADLRLTSTFDQLSLEEVIQILEMTLQIQAQSGENGMILTR